MTITFDRPIGAHGDVKELEYISALHQTGAASLRPNGSIHAEDIVHFLSSRHGIKVDEQTIKKDVMMDLAGDFEENPSNILDLCQVVCLLIIPHLSKVATSGDDEKIHALFGKVLEAVVTDVIGTGASDTGLRLNRDLLRRILDSYGEVDVPDKVLDEMMIAACGSAGSNVILDVPTLMQALTGDVMKYGTDWDTSVSTHYQDVFGTVDNDVKSSAVKDIVNNNDNEDPSAVAAAETREVNEVFTGAAFDTIADTFRSQSFSVIMWVALILIYVCYIRGVDLGSSSSSSYDDDDSISSSTATPAPAPIAFGTQVLRGIARWIFILLQLSILGSGFIMLGSMGNSLERRKFFISWQIVGMITVFMGTIGLYLLPDINTWLFTTTIDDSVLPAYITLMLLGIVLMALQLVQLVGGFFDLDKLKKFKCFETLLTPGIMKLECKTKKAAEHKVSLMIENALVLHTRSSSNSNQSSLMTSNGLALMNFHLSGMQTEKAGGILWAWTKIRNGSIFAQDGVWLHSCLIATSVIQFLVCIFILLMGLLVTYVLSADVMYPDGTGNTIFIPGWQIAVGLGTGVVCGFFACLAVALVYIPSFISTVLQFRTGVIPSLHDKDFLVYRFAIDQATIVFACAFWGCVFTGLIVTYLVGGIAFLTVWNVTRTYAVSIISNILGISVTIVIKILILRMLRRQFYAAFYRKQTAEANYMNVALQCWTLGPATLFMLGRTVKLMLLTALYMGRIDMPFLAPGVGVFGPLTVDVYPMAFRKDLLVHDAHRHPYLERLCTMYMMKLRFGNGFASRAGSYWRLLFVLVLMPWMRKYRIRLSVESLANEICEAEAELAGDEEEEDDFDTWGEPSARVLARASTVRKLDRLRSLQSMRDFDSITSREELLDREVQILRSKIAQLEEKQALGTNQQGQNHTSERRSSIGL